MTTMFYASADGWQRQGQFMTDKRKLATGMFLKKRKQLSHLQNADLK